MPDSLSGKVIGRNALWSMLNQCIGQVLALLVFLVTARFVSKDAFGVMAVAMLAIEFFRQVMIESVGISLAAKRNPSNEDYNAGFLLIVAGSVLAAGVMFLLAGPVSVFLKNPDIEPALRLTCLVLLSMGLSRTQETWMAKNMRFRLLAIRSIVAIAIGGAVGIIMAVNDYGLTSLIVQQILTSVLSLVFLWFSSSWKPHIKTTWEHVRSLFSYSRHVSLNMLTGVIGAQSDIFFSSYYLGAAATGVYNASKRILVATQLMMTGGLNSVALPVFSSYADEQAGLKNIYLKAMIYTAFLTAPFYMGLAVLSKDVIAVVLGQKWLEVAPVLSILCISSFMASIDQYNTNVLLVCKKPHWQTIITALNAATNVLILFLVARHGLLYLAGAMVAKTFLIFPLSLSLAASQVKTKPSDYIAGLYPVAASTALMGIVVDYLRTMFMGGMPPILTLIVLVPTGAIVYVGVMYALNKDMLRSLSHMSLSIIRKN